MKFRRFLSFLLPLAFLKLGIGPDDAGGAADVSVSDAGTGATDASAAASDTGADAAAGAPPAADKPSNMLEAMFGQERQAETPEAKAARLRDEQGRFARKPEEVQGQKPPAAVGDKPGEKPGEKKPDPLAMPEGLTEPAQKRFQQLANTNKDLTARVTEWEPIVASARALQSTFQEHGVRREQFDQAMSVVGMMNRGDFEGALRVLDEQRAMIAMATGKSLPGADALAKFPDLRAEVDDLQMTEERALEIARARTVSQGRQQQEQRQHQEQQTQQREQEAVRQGQMAVDKICQDLQANDLDFARIEPMLIEQIKGGLLQGIPPAAWPGIVQKTYALIKQTAGQVRTSTPSTSVLRPTGQESPRQAPKSGFEAMWGKPAPSA